MPTFLCCALLSRKEHTLIIGFRTDGEIEFSRSLLKRLKKNKDDARVRMYQVRCRQSGADQDMCGGGVWCCHVAVVSGLDVVGNGTAERRKTEHCCRLFGCDVTCGETAGQEPPNLQPSGTCNILFWFCCRHPPHFRNDCGAVPFKGRPTVAAGGPLSLRFPRRLCDRPPGLWPLLVDAINFLSQGYLWHKCVFTLSLVLLPCP